MKAIRLGLVVSIVTTLLAGLYFIVYIYRWEMHRALIAGVVFLAGEIALATTLLLRRLEATRSPEPVARVASVTRSEPAVPVADNSAQPNTPQAPPGAGQSQPFPWLGADRFGVFVPILLGAGTIVSGVGWVVEHLARASNSTTRNGRFERRLALIAAPSTPLVGLAPEPVTASEPKAPTPRLGFIGRLTVALLIGGLVAVLLTLALLGRTRPDPPVAGTQSVLQMEVYTRNGIDVDLAARSLWGACNVMVPKHTLVDMRTTQPNHYVLTIDPALSEQAQRRLLGCLNDGVLEQVHADLGTLTHIEAPR